MSYVWHKTISEQTQPLVDAFVVCCELNEFDMALLSLEVINEILDEYDNIKPFDETVLEN